MKARTLLISVGRLEESVAKYETYSQKHLERILN